MARWLAEIVYRSNSGPISIHHDIEELSELEGIIERGPDWNTVEEIKIVLRRVSSPGLTVEKAEPPVPHMPWLNEDDAP